MNAWELYTWEDLAREYGDQPPQHSHAFWRDTVVRLANELPQEAIFLDVGVRDGGSTLCALWAVKQSRKKWRWVYSVDPYGEKPWRESGRTLPHDLINYPEHHYQRAMSALSGYALAFDLNHVHWRMTSLDYAKVYPQIKFWDRGVEVYEEYGYVYLDGEHSGDTVYAEMEYFMPKMYPGGVIVIDNVMLLEPHEKLDPILKQGVHLQDQIFWTAPEKEE